MPTYEYECTHCGHRFEVSQKMSYKPLKDCPQCQKALRRLIGSGAAIIFKGPGFYATDYRKKPPADTANKDAPVCPKKKEGCNACEQK
jgi:putative FmdB family regulatory protein